MSIDSISIIPFANSGHYSTEGMDSRLRKEDAKKSGLPGINQPFHVESQVKKPGSQQELNEAEKREVERLKKRDAEVRAHERAHIAAGGPYVSGAQFEYQRGPDGHNYAVGGDVSIDTSSIKGDPEATIRKMQIVRRAALAPKDPSPQDRAVAARASQIEAKARMELSQIRLMENTSSNTTGASDGKNYTTEKNLQRDFHLNPFSVIDIIA
ncbi:MAG: putative metalloprotease CJM1_0395 family protein [Thermodesulfobacteriota bacterium]|nr:putative metalloprotease CJM1_0395 family protein [Thermodesulfobacteriota bacterium]